MLQTTAQIIKRLTFANGFKVKADPTGTKISVSFRFFLTKEEKILFKEQLIKGLKELVLFLETEND